MDFDRFLAGPGCQQHFHQNQKRLFRYLATHCYRHPTTPPIHQHQGADLTLLCKKVRLKMNLLVKGSLKSATENSLQTSGKTRQARLGGHEVTPIHLA